MPSIAEGSTDGRLFSWKKCQGGSFWKPQINVAFEGVKLALEILGGSSSVELNGLKLRERESSTHRERSRHDWLKSLSGIMNGTKFITLSDIVLHLSLPIIVLKKVKSDSIMPYYVSYL